MLLWDRVKTTDPKFQKHVNLRGGFTAVDPHWQLMQATKVWGPYGALWGLRNFKYELATVEAVAKDGPYIQTCIILQADFFYPHHEDDREICFPIINDDKFKPGDDSFKKIITNTRSKALSWLGFSADVFMGKFDDANYVKDLQVKFDEQDALVQRVLVAVRTAQNLESLNKCRERLNQMIAHKTIESSLVASELLAEVSQREQEIVSR